MKKIIFITLIILLILPTALCFAQAEEVPEIITYTSGDWDYVENDKGITLTAYRGFQHSGPAIRSYAQHRKEYLHIQH